MSVESTGLAGLVAAVQKEMDDLTAKRDALQDLHAETVLKQGEWSARNIQNPNAEWTTALRNLTTQRAKYEADLVFQYQELDGLIQVKAKLEAIVQRRQARFEQTYLGA